MSVPFSLLSNFVISSLVRKSHFILFFGIDKRLLFGFTFEDRTLLCMRNLRSHSFNSMTWFLNSTNKLSDSDGDGSVELITNTLHDDGDVGLIMISLGDDGSRGKGVGLRSIIFDMMVVII